MMLTTNSLDESLIQRRQREIKELERQRDELTDKVASLQVELQKEKEKNSTLESENSMLKDKLLIYEHDPIIYEESLNGFCIKVWNTNVNDYKIFAQFYDVDFEEDLEEFCKEFVLELKDAYMVE